MTFPFRDKALWVKTGDTDIYGQKAPSENKLIDCSIISLLLTPELTSTGQDVSASRGRAGQVALVSKIIVPLTCKVSRKDIIVVSPADIETGTHMEVQSVLVRNNVVGKPSFIELRLIQTDV